MFNTYTKIFHFNAFQYVYTKIGIFGMKIYHLATPVCMNVTLKWVRIFLKTSLASQIRDIAAFVDNKLSKKSADSLFWGLGYPHTYAVP
jgi:hypothetical protein